VNIPFNKPTAVGSELANIADALARGHLAGNGYYTKRCQRWLEERLGCARALLTHSCTAALEMAALLGDLGPGDEVIMPSYTFVSTANAFVLRGAVPVFVDIRPDTLNIDESQIEAAVTSRTKAIVVVHYGGVACEMDLILEIARRRRLLLIEDAAQALLATYKERKLGTLGDLGCVSFHETKNLISGEGGALLINDDRFSARAEVIHEKGTNRTQMFRGEVDKYTWVDLGSSYLPGEMVAAFLDAQLTHAERVIRRRRVIWERYHAGLTDLENRGLMTLPSSTFADRSPNSHLFYVLTGTEMMRTELAAYLKSRGILAVSHYVPLHSSPAGLRYGRAQGSLTVTSAVSARLLRLPLYFSLSDEEVDRVISAIHDFARAPHASP
jgi:dTDP-4-amino-4,6-dideoxygalactose transaminase